MKKDLLKGLTKEQQEAVTHKDGPILVVAGAGTGKTGVITRRIAWLIQNGTAPEEILALTFTDKAAIEMEERVDALVPYGFIDTWISTFHAFGDRVLREHAIELDLPVDFRVLTDPEKMIIMRDHLFELPLKKLRPLGNPTRYLGDLLRVFSKIKDEDIEAKEYIKWTRNNIEALQQAQGKSGSVVTQSDLEEAEVQREIAECYNAFNGLMLSEGYADFGDQISLCIKLFRENPRILKSYQEKFKYILVDEFQDTNFAQNELLKLLAPAKSNLMVVGDDDQSIYRFRGAAISNILGFLSTWKGAKQIVLTQNFRSATPILEASYRLVTQNNPERLEFTNKINKRLSAAGDNKKQVGKVEWVFSQTKSAEADRVAKKVKELVKGGRMYKDMAILVRKNADATSFQQALNAQGIPYKFSGEAGLYTQPEVIDLMSFISVLCDPEDAMAHFHLVTGEIYGLSAETAVLANSEMRRRSALPETVYADFANGTNSQVSTTDANLLEVFLADISDYRSLMTELTAGQLVYRFLTETGYLKKLLTDANKNAESEIKIQNIAKFFEKIRDFDLISADKSLLKFHEDLKMLIEAGENPATAEVDPDLDAVNILTIHKAKGLEFPIVFMVNLVAGNFPSRNRHDTFEIPAGLIKEQMPEGDQHLAEERRLFYVGMTRAGEELYLSSAEDHGGARRQKVSQFVIEATGEVTEYKEKHKQNVEEKLAQFAVNEDISKMLLGFYEEGKTLVLTPHQIDDYLSCPLKFKYVHIFKLPLMRRHEVIYGSAVHAAVQYYYEAKKRGKKVVVSDLHQAFEKSWVSEGFVTQKHEAERFAKGKVTLENFWKRAEVEGTLPTLVEEPFSFVVGGGEARTKINGRYDAVFDRNGEIEIRDFKTSDVRTQADALKRAKDNRQIAIYALSWQAATGAIPKGVSLDFIESGLLGLVEKKEKELEKTEAEIEKVSAGIRRGEFGADPGWGECGRCAYRTFCPFKK